ncbi:hypothetical protein GCM10022226_32320 [Sphaerisporangium flaviroseum]|uniref:DUF397 domain-containing protein n=1 Tax=Sphaerisporangium flaviroseum TaxID=509199 RepID=A0ABP7I3M6_9ACTN
MDLTDMRWRKSSYSSGNGGDCVEVASIPSGTAVRDSKNPAGAFLRFSPTEWTDFLTAVKEGRFAG